MSQTTIAKKLFSIIGTTAILLASANGFCEGVYEYMNYLEDAATAKSTAEMLLKETEMLKYQIESREHLGKFEYRDLAKVIQKANDITTRGKAISYSMKQLDQQFRNKYPNYNKQRLNGYKEAYSTWDETSLDTFQNSLQSISVTMDDVGNDQKLLGKLKKQSETSEGQTKLLQVGHSLSVNTNQQLMSLKQIVSAQANAQTAYMSRQTSKESYQEKSMQQVIDNLNVDYPTEGKGFGKINFKRGRAH